MPRGTRAGGEVPPALGAARPAAGPRRGRRGPRRAAGVRGRLRCRGARRRLVDLTVAWTRRPHPRGGPHHERHRGSTGRRHLLAPRVRLLRDAQGTARLRPRPCDLDQHLGGRAGCRLRA
ncbi:hypothetical protein [Ornithinimicrobium kibberense]|uniref:hypothetical protein n=1 Tax=Ornithinimicrobium kibberense TaxID=282060 RepID=UPI00360C59CC